MNRFFQRQNVAALITPCPNNSLKKLYSFFLLATIDITNYALDM